MATSATPDRSLLVELDRSTDDFERPTPFDASAVAERFQDLVALLDAAFHCTCAIDAGALQVQDASYFGDAVIPATCTASGDDIWIRVSNFGRLATYGLERPGVYSGDELDLLLDHRDRDRVEASLLRSGHRIIPEDLLNARYDGLFHHRVSTWFGRFFDYL